MRSNRKKLNRDLLDAVVMHDIAKVEDLLNRGADVNPREAEHSETSLILATKFADTDIVRLLLNAKADVNARDDKGRTALFFALVSSYLFNVLLEAGADIHARDEEGNTLLLWKVSESASLGEVEKLLKQGIDPSLQNADGQSTLDIAEGLGLVKIVERLKTATAV